MTRLSQSDAPGFYAGIVTPDRTAGSRRPLADGGTGLLDDLPYRRHRPPRGG